MRLLKPLVFAVLAVALVAIPYGAVAQEKVSADQPYWNCAKACDDCARVCEACATHCSRLVADGKREHLTTMYTCRDCASVCRAGGEVTARSGPFSELICAACADACKRCAEACDHHKDDPIMKRCAEECRACEKACRDMVRQISDRNGKR